MRKKPRIFFIKESLKSQKQFAIVFLSLFFIINPCLLINTFAKTKTLIQIYQIRDYTFRLPSSIGIYYPDHFNLINIEYDDIEYSVIILSEFILKKGNDEVGQIKVFGYEKDGQLPLPNHCKVNIKQKLDGLVTKAYFYNIEISEPHSYLKSAKNENHLFLIFEKDKYVVDIFANTKYISEKTLIDIAKSFKRSEISEIMHVVEKFGQSLKFVDKLSPPSKLKEDITKYYKDYISSQLLSNWLKNPSQAFGRVVSSPWPDRIEGKIFKKINDKKYIVDGVIVEITSAPETFLTRVSITVEKIKNTWLITNIKAYDE